MLNKVMLIGNLGADPEVRYMSSGDTVTNIRLATSRRWKDRNTGEQREETEWHRVTFFNRGNYKLAEIAGEYLKKGSKVYVEGQLKTSKYQKNGQDHYATDIIADQMQMLDSRAGGTAEFGQQGGYVAPQTNQNFQQPQQPQQPQQVQQVQQPPQTQQTQSFNQPAPQQNFQPVQQVNQPVQQQGYQPPPQTPPINQPVNQFTQQPPLQPAPVQQQPPVQQPANPSFNQSQPVPQPANKPASSPAADDFDDDVPF